MRVKNVSNPGKRINIVCGILVFLGVINLVFAGKAVPVALVDTCRDPSFKSQNMFEGYWSVFDDNPKSVLYTGLWTDSTGFTDTLKSGNSKITNFAKLDIENYEEFKMTPGGCTSSPSYGAMIAFQFGDSFPFWGMGADETYGNFVGLGCELISSRRVLNLKGATKVSYWAKASDTITCSFIVGTKQGTFKEFGTYYEISHKFTPEWKEYFVYLREKDPNITSDSMYLAQPQWAIDEQNTLVMPWETTQQGVLPLDISKTQMLEWLLGGAGEDGHVNKAWHMLPGTLWVDQVTIENYTWYPEDACMECDTCLNGQTSQVGTHLKLTDGGNFNELDEGAWYAYNDAKGRDVSIPIVQYSWIDTTMASYPPPDTTTPILKLLDATGVTAVAGDTAPYVSYILGPNYKQVSTVNPLDTNEVKPFVGIGLSLVDEDNVNQCFNADSAGYQGFYFEYKTSGAVKWLNVSVDTRQTLVEDGAAFYVKIPPTAGVWRGAIIPFANLALPPWDEKDTVSFDRTKLVALQFYVEGDSADAGSFAIDNVYLLDSAYVGIKFITPVTQLSSGFSLKQIHNNLVYTMPKGANSAIVQLYNLKGRALYSERVKAVAGKTYTVPVSARSIANGVYIFRMQTLGNVKKSITRTVTIVK